MLRLTLLNSVPFIFFVRIVRYRSKIDVTLIDIGGILLIMLIVLKVVVKLLWLSFLAVFAVSVALDLIASKALTGALGLNLLFFYVWCTGVYISISIRDLLCVCINHNECLSGAINLIVSISFLIKSGLLFLLNLHSFVAFSVENMYFSNCRYKIE